MVIKEYLHSKKMKENTKHIEITTLNNSIDELNKNIVKLIKLLEDKKSKKR